MKILLWDTIAALQAGLAHVAASGGIAPIFPSIPASVVAHVDQMLGAIEIREAEYSTQPAIPFAVIAERGETQSQTFLGSSDSLIASGVTVSVVADSKTGAAVLAQITRYIAHKSRLDFLRRGYVSYAVSSLDAADLIEEWEGEIAYQAAIKIDASHALEVAPFDAAGLVDAIRVNVFNHGGLVR
jgi:hypothetical protein